ncbi:hypothetical protein [Roseibacillus ishigakijimensis]|uniref:Uncharacterized protein n=1 Tax=Roseibacillus ishigakijimensis TaxID=454146 RepID=A0A934VMD9_9BACT|nr:hypothetical protein [Roseibacillus ishigakijimensis]MBK1835654.1 hypothetical protein [Roseibacillus ishigakijimensis]
MTKAEIQDLYFMDSRAKLIDIASFLDRLDRMEGEADFRHPAFLGAMEAMKNPPEGRTRVQAVLEALSDHSEEPAESASIGFAYGAQKPN